MILNYAFEFMEIEDEVVAVPVGDNAGKLHGIVKLNATGAEILKMLQEEKSETEIVTELCNKYAATIAEMENYVSGFLSGLRNKGLLE